MSNFLKILAVIITAAAAAAALVLLIDSIRQKRLTTSKEYDYDEYDSLDDGLDEDDLSFLDSYEEEPEDETL
ncbi:MAG: hypothetical protein J6F31_10270 [Oscillospiraceae bacterium]|nr:hypothetical protein [Oscillospiraceae bacterium]